MHTDAMPELTFVHLNQSWNAEPNAPALRMAVVGDTVTLSFNPFAHHAAENEIGHIAFTGCTRWRWDSTNDHSWFSGRGPQGDFVMTDFATPARAQFSVERTYAASVDEVWALWTNDGGY